MAFDRVTTTMGYDALWIPSDGSQPAGHTARVLLNNPTEGKTLAGVEYNPYGWQIEYRNSFFPGLADAVRSGSTEEVTANSQDFIVRDVHTKFDGNTIVLMVEPKVLPTIAPPVTTPPQDRP